MLTRKWYAVKKKNHSNEKIQEIKEILNVTPYIPKGFGPPAKSFPVYKESDEKLFVPRRFGIEYFGNPEKIVIKDGLPISVKFNGELRSLQKPIVSQVYKELKKKGHCIMSAATGVGKCHGINTQILMFDGSIKMVQDIKIGDKIMGDDSTCRIVKSLGNGRDMMFKIVPRKGESFIVNSEHVLCLKISGNKLHNNGLVRYFDTKMLKCIRKKFNTYEEAQHFYSNLDNILDIPLNKYLELSKDSKRVLKLYKNAIDFSHKDIPFDPYIIGLWLGNGSSKGTNISNQDSVIIKLSLINNKHIPDIYKINSREIRLQLLAGLIDSDGYLHNNTFEICQKNKKITDDIVFLARSLGFATYKKEKQTCWHYDGIKKYGKAFRITISGDVDKIPTKIKRNHAFTRKQIKNVLVNRFCVEKLKEDNYYGFTLDKNHRYLMGDFTVTHNTVMALNLVTKLKQKTLILVHQDFLLNQWIERIKQYIPISKIGIIKQNQLEVEDKDIVIGMIQSICSRNYGSDVFKQFGFVLIDELHHCGAEYFSQVLYSCGAKYMLGLSATPTRKDGLTKILKWHLGKVLAFSKQDIQFKVKVECIRFKPNHNEFKIKKSYYGGINIANLINQICQNETRNKMIIHELIKYGRMGRQILVLSDRVQHLKNLKDQIPDDITTGLYIGGMTQDERKISETKTIIFGTFILIKEAVDIPTLNTMLLSTSKSDIVQAVGRILRKQHPKFNPLIIDMVDELSLFERQAEKRKKYYLKQGYEIDDPDHVQIIETPISDECLF